MFALRAAALLLFSVLPCIAPAAAPASAPASGARTDPAAPAPALTAPGRSAQLLPDGTAAAPADAPAAVQQVVWGANRIQDRPYAWGGGHGRFEDRGYDCSGAVSYALHAGGLLSSALDSGSFMRWGARGRGQWITVYANAGHAYAVIAGLRLDTSAAGVSSALAGSKALERGPRWRPVARAMRGFKARHPAGF